MRRFYVAPIVGSGTDSDPYRLGVADYGGNHKAQIPVGVDGRPLHSWGIAAVDRDDHGPLLTNPNLHALPGGSLDRELRPAERAALRLRLAALGVTALLPTTLTTRTALRWLANRIGVDRHYEPSEN